MKPSVGVLQKAGRGTFQQLEQPSGNGSDGDGKNEDDDDESEMWRQLDEVDVQPRECGRYRAGYGQHRWRG